MTLSPSDLERMARVVEAVIRQHNADARIYGKAADIREFSKELAQAAWNASRGLAMEEALRAIVNESVFNQQRFAEDDDTDYFLRCFRAVKERARLALGSDQ